MEPVTTLSAGLVALLAPLLPYLTGIGKAAADAAAERTGQAIGKAALQRSTALWRRLWPRLHDQRRAREAVIAIARDPAAEQARAVLADEIAVLLTGDPKLASETAALLRKVRNRGVRIDVERIKISGDQNVVQLGEHNLSIGQAQNVEILDRTNPDEHRQW
jgi:hypothetical protein